MTTLVVALAFTALSSAQAPAPGATRIAYRQQLLIQLGVSDLDRAIAFYTNVLEFELTERRNDLKFAHLDTNVPGLQVGLNEVGVVKGTGTAVLNISVTDVMVARQLLESRGVVFRGATVIIPRKVALAEFSDPDGNTLRLAGPPPPSTP
jgi:predicted enzyme related to lactoylglutathione lyase